MEYTIVRRRIVTQVQTDYIQADSDEEALKIANQGQSDQHLLWLHDLLHNTRHDLTQGWHDLTVEYPEATPISILEAVKE